MSRDLSLGVFSSEGLNFSPVSYAKPYQIWIFYSLKFLNLQLLHSGVFSLKNWRWKYLLIQSLLVFNGNLTFEAGLPAYLMHDSFDNVEKSVFRATQETCLPVWPTPWIMRATWLWTCRWSVLVILLDKYLTFYDIWMFLYSIDGQKFLKSSNRCLEINLGNVGQK
jgi:hypothetical protein